MERVKTGIISKEFLDKYESVYFANEEQTIYIVSKRFREELKYNYVRASDEKLLLNDSMLRGKLLPGGEIGVQFAVRHAHTEIPVGEGCMIGKTENVHPDVQRRSNIIFLRAHGMQAAAGMGMVIGSHMGPLPG